VTSPLGVMSVILLEVAVGSAVLLWAGGVWGKVRRGFFLLIGSTIVLSALGAWRLAANEFADGGVKTDRAITALGIFTALTLAWQIMLFVQQAVSRYVGLAATAAGVVALALVGLARPNDPARAVLELALGAVFLGATNYGLLLGHWYLVERKLTNQPMIRSAWWYVAGCVAGVGTAILSATNPAPDPGGLSPYFGVPGFSVLLAGGLVAVCALISGFVVKLANEGGRSIQAATGMFYLAVIMAFSAEMAAKVRFFSTG